MTSRIVALVETMAAIVLLFLLGALMAACGADEVWP